MKNSNIRDHVLSDQHTHAFSLFNREKAATHGESSLSFSPIAQLSYECFI